MTENPEKEWFTQWFNNPLYLKLYSHRDEAEAKTCLETIIKETDIDTQTPSRTTVLDIACGAGRHALEFARRGFVTFANDLSPFLLECTRKLAAKENLPITCMRQDMRQLSIENTFDLVVQIFSSFGYFKTKEEDRMVLQNVYASLKQGGWYILDLINPTVLKTNLTPFSSRTIDDLQISEQREIVHDRVIKQITIQAPDESISFEESMRLYEPEAMDDMLGAAGFVIEKMLGDYEGSAYRRELSPRIMIFARKRG